MSLIRAYEDLTSNVFLMDTNYDGRHDRLQAYGNGNRETEYLVGMQNRLQAVVVVF